MEKLYQQAPYTVKFEAEVISCKEGKTGFEVILNRTAFYPEGGGQPSDTGVLGGAKVLSVHEKAGEIIHYTDAALNPGEIIQGTIDWNQRFSNMQQHSGEHIVSGLIHAHFGYDNVGFHMGNEEMTIDLNGVLTWEQLMDIEQEANRMIYKNIPLCITYPSEEELETISYRSKKELTGQVRIVEVPGADVCACCGTHVERTGEIGIIKFISMIHYKTGVRISMLCGEKALLACERRIDQTNRISAILSAKQDNIVVAVEKLKQDALEKEGQIAGLKRQLITIKAEQFEDREMRADQCLLVFEPELSPILVRQFCDLLLEKNKGLIAAVCSEKMAGEYNYCIGSRAGGMKSLGKNLNEELTGKGGGTDLMIQGTFHAEEQDIRFAFEKETAKVRREDIII
ncbi:MAG: alanine--tRNA ligase-related protein [Clostridium sp.]